MQQRLDSARLYGGAVLLVTLMACAAKDNGGSESKAGDSPANKPVGASTAVSGCPTASEVSTILGFGMRQLAGAQAGNEFICEYSEASHLGGTAVVTTVAPASEAAEIIASMGTAVKAMGGQSAEMETISIGEGGHAYGTTEKSEAATVASGHLYHVEITVQGLDGHGEKKDAAIALLKRIMQ